MNLKLRHSISAALFTATLFTSNTILGDAAGAKQIAPLKPDVPYVFVVHNGRSIRVERDQVDQLKARYDIRGMMLQQSTSCPPFCLQPIKLDVPVETWAEAEIIDFMLLDLRDDTGVLIDVRSKREYNNSTIPGSINFFAADAIKGAGDTQFVAMLESFGARKHDGLDTLTRIKGMIGLEDSNLVTDNWDFRDAKTLVLWTSSAMEPSVVKVVYALLDAGYPASKLKWYRGGMASWQYWGFNTVAKPKR